MELSTVQEKCLSKYKQSFQEEGVQASVINDMTGDTHFVHDLRFTSSDKKSYITMVNWIADDVGATRITESQLVECNSTNEIAKILHDRIPQEENND